MTNSLHICFAEGAEVGVHKSHLMQVVIEGRVSSDELDCDPVIIPAGEEPCQIFMGGLGPLAEG